MNDGKGPDILALAEVESERAADLLRQALNKRLGKPELASPEAVFLDASGGRHIATAVITRLPVERDRSQLLGRRMRILETRIKVNGHSLVLIASHWSSKLSDKTGATRAKYGDAIHGRFRGMYKANPKIDFVVCGDFNDDPTEPSVVEHLRATGDLKAVKAGGDPPLLFNLFVKAWQNGEVTWQDSPKKKHLFDQICVSPGMLDNEGWSCDVNSAAIVRQLVNHLDRPNRFGTARDKRPYSVRGASDHFPVTVRLRVR